MNENAVPEGSWRISDSDREAAAQALGEHYATGRLDKAEYDERVDRAWAARTNLELPPLFADLPDPRGRVVAPEARARVTPAEAFAFARRRTGWPPRWGGPVRPWVFLVILLVVLVNAPWLLLVPVVAWWVLRPGRRWR